MRNKSLLVISLVVVATLFPISKTVEVEVHIKKPVKVATKATMAQKRANIILAQQYARAGWGWTGHQWQCAYKIFMKESRFDHLAKNMQGSSAFGIGQVLKEKSKDPAIQLLHAYKYIEHRYDTPCTAWSHHRRGWY